MDPKHIQVLQSHRSTLVEDLKPSDLYDGLLEKGILTQDMIEEIQSSGTRRDQARQLLRDLEKRGSRAFPCFIQGLNETGQLPLAELLLGGQAPDQPQPQPHIGSPDRYIHPSPEGEARRRHNSAQRYKMDASPCGHCLIINNEKFEPSADLRDRTGSNVDCDKLEKRFKSMNFIVVVKMNLRYKQITHELLELSKMDHSQFDCCVVIILSHGTEVNHNRFPGAVHGVDGPAVPIQFITNQLNGQHCPSLQGKPKLFFIQACGGGEKDKGFAVPPDEATPCAGGDDDETDAIPMSSSSDSLSTSDEPDARATLPTSSDILVSYSTSPGFVSWRDPRLGSWYVEILDRVLEENAATDNLAAMLTIVNHEVSQNSAMGLYKQMPGSFNFLRKILYFQTPPQTQTSD